MLIETVVIAGVVGALAFGARYWINRAPWQEEFAKAEDINQPPPDEADFGDAPLVFYVETKNGS